MTRQITFKILIVSVVVRLSPGILIIILITRVSFLFSKNITRCHARYKGYGRSYWLKKFSFNPRKRAKHHRYQRMVIPLNSEDDGTTWNSEIDRTTRREMALYPHVTEDTYHKREDSCHNGDRLDHHDSEEELRIPVMARADNPADPVIPTVYVRPPNNAQSIVDTNNPTDRPTLPRNGKEDVIQASPRNIKAEAIRDGSLAPHHPQSLQAQATMSLDLPSGSGTSKRERKHCPTRQAQTATASSLLLGSRPIKSKGKNIRSSKKKKNLVLPSQGALLDAIPESEYATNYGITGIVDPDRSDTYRTLVPREDQTMPSSALTKPPCTSLPPSYFSPISCSHEQVGGTHKFMGEYHASASDESTPRVIDWRAWNLFSMGRHFADLRSRSLLNKEALDDLSDNEGSDIVIDMWLNEARSQLNWTTNNPHRGLSDNLFNSANRGRTCSELLMGGDANHLNMHQLPMDRETSRHFIEGRVTTMKIILSKMAKHTENVALELLFQGWGLNADGVHLMNECDFEAAMRSNLLLLQLVRVSSMLYKINRNCIGVNNPDKVTEMLAAVDDFLLDSSLWG